jgi:thiol-disulfide isomerase/thioredoxin
MNQVLSVPTDYLVFLGISFISTLGIYLLARKGNHLQFLSATKHLDFTTDEKKALSSQGLDQSITLITIFALTWKLSPALFSFSTVIREPLALLYLPGGRWGTILAFVVTIGYGVIWTLKHRKTQSKEHRFLKGFVSLWAITMLILGFAGFRILDMVEQGLFRSMPENYGPFTGMEAPDFALPALLGPELVNPLPNSEESRTLSNIQDLAGARGTVVLSALRGRPVLINFWATWCPPCRAEFPELVALQEELRDQVAIIAVNLTQTESSLEDVRRFVLSKEGEGMIHLLDIDGTIGALYQARVVPTTLLIDADGMVRMRRSGAVSRDLLRGPLENLIVEAQTSSFR